MTANFASGATKYWDINGAGGGANSTTTAAGTWDTTTANWSTDSTGSSAGTTFVAGTDSAVFSAGTNATGTFTVSLGAPLTAASVLVEEGTITKGGSALTTQSITVNSGATFLYNASGGIVASAGATLTLNGTGATFGYTAGGAGGTFLTTNMGIVLNGGGTLSDALGSPNIYGGVISGTGNLVKVGAGVLALTNTSTYSGSTIVNAGTIRLRTGTPQIPNTDLVVSGTGGFDAATFSQTIQSLSGNGLLPFSGAGTLAITGTASTTFSGVWSGSGRINVNKSGGTGTLVLSGTNTGTGQFFVTSGTVTVNAGATLCGSVCDVFVNGGTLNLNNTTQTIENLSGTGGTLNLVTGLNLISEPIASTTMAAKISGAGGLQKNNANATVRTLTLTGNNDYTGVTTVNAGIISVGNANALGTTAGDTQVLSGGELLFTGAAQNYTVAEPIRIAGAGSTDGAAIAVISSATPTLSGAITLTADATVTVASTSAVQFTNAAAFTGTNRTLSLTGGSGAGAGGTIAGVISLGTGGISKSQGGNWRLSTANAYDGATSIAAGTLTVSNDGALGSAVGGTTVASGATLRFMGNINYATAEAVSIAGTGASTGAINNLSGTNTFAGAVTMTADSSIGVSAGSLTLTGGVGGAFNLTKSGTGSLIVGANTYTGTTTISSGTLVATADGALGTSGNGTTVSSGAALGFQGGINYAAAEAVGITGSGLSSTGSIISISGSNTFGGAVTLTGNASIGVTANDLTLSNAVAGSTFTLTKVGAGNLILGAVNTYGPTVITAGTLTPAVVDGLPAAQNVTINGGTLDIGANDQGSTVPTQLGTVTLTNGTINGTGTITAGNYAVAAGTVNTPLAGTTAALTKTTVGAATLNGVNSYGGGTNVNGGTLTTGAVGALPSGGAVSVGGGTLDIVDKNQAVGAVIMTGGAINGTTGVLSATGYTVEAGSASAILAGSGAALAKNTAGTVTLTGANTYDGGTTVNAGTLAAGAINTLPVGQAVTVSGGTLDIADKDQSVGQVVLTGGAINGTTGVLTTGAATYGVEAGSISAILAGTGVSLVKYTAGTATLTGANTYDNGTGINAGTLLVNNTSGSGTGTGTVAVQSTGTLGGSGIISGTANVSSGGTVAPGAALPGTLTVGEATLNAGSALAFDVGTLSDQLKVTTTSIGLGLQLGANTIQVNLAAAPGFAPGTYALIDYDTGYTGSLGSLGLGSIPAGLDYSIVDNTTNTTIDVVVSLQNRSWVADADGNWSVGSNWGVLQSQPNGVGASANLTATTPLDPDQTVTLDDGNKTVGTINFVNSSKYTIAATGGNKIIVDTFSGNGAINDSLGDHHISADVQLNKDVDVTVSNLVDTLTISGAITGAAKTVTKLGNGSLYLTGINTYSGGTTVSAGTLIGTTTGIQGNVLNNSAVIFSQATTGTYAGNLSGATGTVDIQGGGTVVFTGTNTYGGVTTISGGSTLATGAVNTLSSASAVNVNNGTLDIADKNQTIASAVTLTFGSIAGTTGTLTASSYAVEAGTVSAKLGGASSALTKTTAGTVTLSGANTYGGGTNVNAGTLAAGAANTLPATGAVSVAGGTLDVATFNQTTGAVTLSSGSIAGTTGVLTGSSYAVESGSVSAILGGTAALTKSTAGTVTLSGNNSYSGINNLNGGVLSVGSSANLGDGSATNGIAFNGGALTTSAAVSSAARNISVAAGGGMINSGGFNSSFGNVTGAGTLIKNEAGVVTVNHVRSTGLTVTGGSVQVAAGGTSASTSVVTNLSIVSGNFDVNDNKLVVTGGTLGTYSGGYNGVTGQVAAGRNGGTWDGNGIITSQSNALAAQTYLTTLAVAKASDAKGLGVGETATFGGQTVNDADILVMYTWNGDANLSGKVDADDYFQIDANYNKSGTVDGFYNGDFNYDGQINGDDYFLIDAAYVGQTGVFPAAPGGLSGVSAVPEPTSLALVGMAAMALGRRSRRRAAK